MQADRRLANGDSTDFWESAARERLVFQQCDACANVQFPPRHQCAVCWSDCLGPIDSAGTGKIESVTVVRRAPVAAVRTKVPYVVAAIRVDEGPRMITNIVGPDFLSASAGDRVEVSFERNEDGTVLPQFRLIAGA